MSTKAKMILKADKIKNCAKFLQNDLIIKTERYKILLIYSNFLIICCTLFKIIFIKISMEWGIISQI